MILERKLSGGAIPGAAGSRTPAPISTALFNNRQEWLAGTEPTNALSVLRMLTPVSGRQGVSADFKV